MNSKQTPYSIGYINSISGCRLPMRIYFVMNTLLQSLPNNLKTDATFKDTNNDIVAYGRTETHVNQIDHIYIQTFVHLKLEY